MVLSLKQRILWWSTASTLFIILAVFLFVDRALRTTIRSDLEENVAAGVPFAVALHRAEVDRLLDRTVTMALEPTLRAAVETGDPATVRANLEPLLESFDIDWLAVTTPTGEIVAATATAPRGRITDAERLLEEANFYDTGDLWLADGELVQVQASGVLMEGATVAILVSGKRFGADLVNRLEIATRQRISLHARGAALAGVEDLAPAVRARFVAAWDEGPALDPRAVLSGGQVSPATLEEIGAGDGQRYVGAVIPLPDAFGEAVASLVVYRSLTEAMRPARQMRLALSGITGVGLILAFGLSVGLSRGVTRPVDRLITETVRLGSGDLDHPVIPDREDEIGELAEAFELMRVSLKEARDKLIRAERLAGLGRAASAIVHDFSGPLTTINFHTHALASEGIPAEGRDAEVAGIQDEVARLTAMMREILEFAHGDEHVDMTEGAVHDLLSQVADGTRPTLAERDIVLEVVHGYDGMWVLDFPRTTRILENLVRNAAAAIGTGGAIRLESLRREGGLRLAVEDDGPGIPEELRETVFNPWVTYGKKGGTGLGLAIARSFAETQGGTIRFETSEMGTAFLLDFPTNGAVT